MAASENTRDELAAIPEAIASGEYLRVALILRSAYDDLGEVDLRLALTALDSSALTGASEEGLMSVATADTETHSIFNLGVALWDADWRESEAVDVMKFAHEIGAEGAGLALAEYLSWLREDAEAELLLLSLLRSRAGSTRAEGLLGRLYFENQGRTDERVKELLEADVSNSSSAHAYSKLLVLRKEVAAAAEFLMSKSSEGEKWAPILLGNLRKEWLEDRLGAETAYLRGIELGDYYSATNLGLMLIDQGDALRGREWLEYAEKRGDIRAASALEAE